MSRHDITERESKRALAPASIHTQRRAGWVRMCSRHANNITTHDDVVCVWSGVCSRARIEVAAKLWGKWECYCYVYTCCLNTHIIIILYIGRVSGSVDASDWFRFETALILQTRWSDNKVLLCIGHFRFSNIAEFNLRSILLCALNYQKESGDLKILKEGKLYTILENYALTKVNIPDPCTKYNLETISNT